MAIKSTYIDILSPVSGSLITDNQSSDMYQALFGNVATMRLTGGQLYAPFDGYLTHIDRLNYSLRYSCLNGLQFWFKVGDNPAQLHTQGCEIMHPVSKKLVKGTLLMQFNQALLKQVDAPMVRIILVNAAKLKQVDIKKARQYLALEDSLMTIQL